MDKIIVGLLTDFGNDFAVASIRGTLLKDIPHATIVDIDHSIDKFSLISAAFIIDKVHQFFPAGTIFICVVDPGVGSEREALYVQAHGYHFFGPNNGIFHYLIKQASTLEAYTINTDEFQVDSNTFHGRDLFAPAAASFASGNRNFLIPLPITHLKTLPHLETDSLITFIDSFGNIKTNIPFSQDLVSNNKQYAITINGITSLIPLVTTFSNVPSGTLLGYCGSNKTLEIAVNLGSAGRYFSAKAGDRISLSIRN